MKLKFLTLSVLSIFFGSAAFAQHTLQLDDGLGLGHITTLLSSTPGGTFTFPSGVGTVMTSSGGVSPVWLVGGNNTPTSGILGSLTAHDVVVTTNNTTRATFTAAPAAATPVLTFNNTTAGIQGVRINGSLDAAVGNTLASNPGVWDMVVDGDEVVSGILKVGNSMWFDGNSATHVITANSPVDVTTTTNDSIRFSTNNSTRMVVARNGFVGVNTLNPIAALHIIATPPDPTNLNAANFLVPDPNNHVMTVENLASNSKGNGIAVIIHNPAGVLTPFQANSDGATNNNESNYMTFYNDVGVNTSTGVANHNSIKGRIEGFSYENYTQLYDAIQAVGGSFFGNPENYNPFNYFTFQMELDPNFITFNSNFFTFPSLTLCDLSFSLGSYDFGSIDFGALGSVDLGTVSLGSLDMGNILPCGLSAPSISSPFTINGPPVTHLLDPFAINYAFIDNMVAPLMALPYKDKVASIVADPMSAAVAFGTSFLGGVTFESGSGDYAEWLERADHSEKIGIGDVVGVVGGKITKNTVGADQLMVVTWKPIVLGNMPDAGKEQFSEKVAFLGQIPVKMTGAVKNGDYIVADGNNNGFAKAISPSDISANDLGNVLGVAWEDSPESGAKFVKVAVGLKPHEMTKVIKDQSQKLDELTAKAEEIAPMAADVAALKASLTTAQTAKYAKKKSKVAATVRQ
jgi:hypothetical protein